MGKKYIITLADEYTVGGKIGVPVTIDGNHTAWICTGIELTPYTEPDLEQVRKEAYEEGAKSSAVVIADDRAHEAYQRGLSDAWEAARKIANMYSEERKKIFGENLIQKIQIIYSASEAVEKIRQYEQEKERQARIEFNCEEIKDVLNATVKECNVSLDEIAAVLEKMRESE